MFKKFLASAAIFAMVLTGISTIHATGMVTPSITFTATSTTAGLYEVPLPPNTTKSITGRYYFRNSNGDIQYKVYNGYIQTGQLYVTSYAASGYTSYSSSFGYYLNGNYICLFDYLFISS